MITTQQPLIYNVWERLIAPHPSITDIEQRRQSRLLSVMMLTLTTLVGLTGLRQLYVNTMYADTDWVAVFLAFTAVFLAVPIYWLNHSGHYKIGARAFTALAFVLIASYSVFDTFGAFFGSLIVLFSAIFLTYTETQVVVGLVLGIHALWAFPHNHLTAFFFNVYIAVLILLFVRFRTRLEQERQQQLRDTNDKLRASEGALQQINVTLEEKVKARTLELEHAKEEAERASHVKSAFLASMSHELRTPLNAIINFTKFVANGDLGEINKDQAETLTEVVSSGKHLLNLINDVLDMSKIEAGSLNLFIEENVDLQAILTSVESMSKSLLADKPVELKVETDETLPRIRADRQRIFQVLLNIMSNACKFTSNGSIWLRAIHTDNEILLSVQDTGPGIAPDDQSLVFEAFKQTETGLRQGGGTGLGMPISRSLVEAHGGRLWLTSEPGKGTTFFVALPIKSMQLVPMFDNMERVA